MEKDENVIKILGDSNPGKTAGSIVHVFKEKGYADVRAIGAGAVNQAVKSIIIARQMIFNGDSLCETAIIPKFENVPSNYGEEDKMITAISFRIIKIKTLEGEIDEGSKKNIEIYDNN